MERIPAVLAGDFNSNVANETPWWLDDVFDGVSQRAFQHAPHAFSFATSISPKRGTLIDGMVATAGLEPLTCNRTLEVAEDLVGRLGHLPVRIRLPVDDMILTRESQKKCVDDRRYQSGQNLVISKRRKVRVR